MKIDFRNVAGKVKYMNGVNNGPVEPDVRTTINNFEAYRAAGIPYARNHDASFYNKYGGEHIVDVHRIFKNFDADENDPGSYIFEPTDKYLLNTVAAGTKVFYRLGASIEHGYKYGTRVPKDFGKWARICEHIIRHYTQGWAHGYELDIEYWEIWNEADCVNYDGTSPCWQGTQEEFISFYCTAAKHLKAAFPHLKIGGPAFANVWYNDAFVDKFLTAVKADNIPMDFFSFHWYGRNVADLQVSLAKAEDILFRQHGFQNTELILNEWNYIRGWREEEWQYSLKVEKSLKGASFVAACMAVAQPTALDMLMYYDARPCCMNGMFDTDTLQPLKAYYPFVMFRKLLDLGTYVEHPHDKEDIYSCAATDGENHAVMLTYYHDDDSLPAKEVQIQVENLQPGIWDVAFYLLDEQNDHQLVRKDVIQGEHTALYLHMKLFDTYYIQFTRR